MNKTERAFYNVLINDYKINEENIRFSPISSPDFEIMNNSEVVKGYEVKCIKYGVIRIQIQQDKELRKNKERNHIVVMDKDIGKPLKIISYTKIKEKNFQIIDGIKVYIIYGKRLVIELDKKFVDYVEKWKRLWLSKYGLGGIKKRIQEIIEEDLKKLNKEK